MKVIKQEVVELIKDNPKALGRLCYDFAKNTKTITRWLDREGNWEMLTTPKGIDAISEELSIKKSEILTES